MSVAVIIRLQKLPWSANAADIRQFFFGLQIPEGGVHIVGGRDGDAFIAFSSDEDARQAMRLDGKKIRDTRIKLLLSSRMEMQKVIEKARGDYAQPLSTPNRSRSSRSRSKSRSRSRSPRSRSRSRERDGNLEKRRRSRSPPPGDYGRPTFRGQPPQLQRPITTAENNTLKDWPPRSVSGFASFPGQLNQEQQAYPPTKNLLQNENTAAWGEAQPRNTFDNYRRGNEEREPSFWSQNDKQERGFPNEDRRNLARQDQQEIPGLSVNSPWEFNRGLFQGPGPAATTSGGFPPQQQNRTLQLPQYPGQAGDFKRDNL